MSFKYPWLLLLLLLVPLLLYFRYGKHGRPAAIFSDNTLLKSLPVSWAIVGSRLLPVLFGIGLSLLICAVARPQKGLDESKVRTEVIDIVLLLDLSTSMQAEDFKDKGKVMNRLQASKAVIRRFVEARPNDRIGLVAFAALPYSASPLTLDHPWLVQRMDSLRIGNLQDGTAIGDAIASAVNRLRDSKAKSKIVVLLTDGMQTAGTLSPMNAAQAAKALDIKVYTVGAGKEGFVRRGGLMGGFYSEIDEESLKEVAKITHGMFFRAQDFNTLESIYGQIDEMERTEVDIEYFTNYEELFAPFVVASLFLFSLEQLLAQTRFRRIP